MTVFQISKTTPLLFYDGSCGFCNHSVQFILNNEKNEDLLFGALQSNSAKDVLNAHGMDAINLSTIYFIKGNTIHAKSRAVFAVIPYLKWYWQPLLIARILPRKWTDATYDFIAERRTKLAKSFCIIPTENQLKRILP